MNKNIIALLILVLIIIFSGCTENPDGEAIKTLTDDTKITEPTQELTEITGNLEIIVVDDFENNKADYLYYLHSKDKIYELEFEKYFFRNFKAVKLNVEGQLKGTKIFVKSFKIIDRLEKSSLEKSSSEGVLGEQKYLAVLLRLPDESIPPNFELNINSTFVEIDAYIETASYGKASFLGEYFGDLILPEDTNFSNFFNYVHYIIKPQIEAEVDLTEYAGIIYYNNFRWNLGSGGIMPTMYMKTDSVKYPLIKTAFIHELGHTFGLSHATLLLCGDVPNRTPLGPMCWFWEYGDFYDPMGYSTRRQHPNVATKLTRLNWLDSENVPEVEQGTFFISNLEFPLLGASDIKGLKIPIIWDMNTEVDVNHYQTWPYYVDYVVPIAEHGMTNYYLDYRSPIEFQIGMDYYETEGVLIRLGEDEFSPDIYYNTLALTMNPNKQVCYEDPNGGDKEICYETSNNFAYLEKNETYTDNLNNMTITVLDTNESGALIEICRDRDEDGYYSCGNSSNTTDCDDSNSNINPSKPEVCGNGIDDNCDGLTDSQDSTCTCEANSGKCIIPYHSDPCPTTIAEPERELITGPEYYCSTGNCCVIKSTPILK